MTHPPPSLTDVELRALSQAIDDLNTGDADYFRLVWHAGRHDRHQFFIWPMRLRAPQQGSGALVYSPRGDH